MTTSDLPPSIEELAEKVSHEVKESADKAFTQYKRILDECDLLAYSPFISLLDALRMIVVFLPRVPVIGTQMFRNSNTFEEVVFKSKGDEAKALKFQDALILARSEGRFQTIYDGGVEKLRPIDALRVARWSGYPLRPTLKQILQELETSEAAANANRSKPEAQTPNIIQNVFVIQEPPDPHKTQPDKMNEFIPIETVYAEGKVVGKKKRAALKSALRRRMNSSTIDIRHDRTTPTKTRTLYKRCQALDVAQKYSR